VPDVRWSVGVFLSQILFDWGQRSALQRSSEKEANAATLRVGESKNNIRLVVSAAYYNVLRAQRLMNVATERRESAQEQLRVATERFNNDVAPRFDVIRSEAELANAEQEVIQAQNEIALSEATFNTALGRDVAMSVALKPETSELTTPVPFETARKATLKNRPELLAQDELIKANQDLVRARRAENKPQVSLQSGYSRQNPTGFNTGQSYNAGLVMTFPFLDSGLTRNRVREAQAQTEIQQHFYEQTRQQVELDLKQALLDMEEARLRINSANKELTSAREALRVAEVRYRAGVGTNVEVTDAQVAVARAGQNVANARFDFLTALARTENAAGAPVTALR
jgi:outer membrane protein TolC